MAETRADLELMAHGVLIGPHQRGAALVHHRHQLPAHAIRRP